MKPTRVVIPDQLKSDLPQTTFGKILGATPVVMAVVATMLAGLASSEMTKAQYVRSLGAQQQSKAGDQWSFFQAKRVRSAIQLNTAEMLQSMTEVRRLNPATVVQQIESGSSSDPALKQKTLSLVQSDIGRQTLEILGKSTPPPAPAAIEIDPEIKAAMEGVENSIPDAEMRALLAKVNNARVEDALKNTRDQIKAFEAATKPLNQAVEQLHSLLEQEASLATGSADAPSGSASLLRSFNPARLRYTANRYDVEARLNQTVANLYEVQVRMSNIKAEHHHGRSQRFFFGMLAAQAGVIISTFAMAARNRNLLWSLAAGAGLVAVVFAVYVYLYT